MVAASGDRLLVPEAVAALKQELIPLASLITPNLPEAAALLEEPLAADEEAMTVQGRMLVRQGAKAVLVKGGHATGEDSVDILVTAEKVRRYAARRVATQNTHGTGCTLSSAIAAFLARGLSAESAIAEAKDYLTGGHRGRRRPRGRPRSRTRSPFSPLVAIMNRT